MYYRLPKLLQIGRKSTFLLNIVKHGSIGRMMGDVKLSNNGLPLQQIVDAMHAFAEEKLAASWDNVGLLIEPIQPKLISEILLTNDLTEDVMEEAVDCNIDLIISYHPPIFAPLKSVTTRTWKERIVATCLENKIAVFSPHTCFDSVRCGVNDWLASAFKLKTSNPIEPGENPENGMGRVCTLKEPVSVAQAINLIKQHTGLPYVRLARARHGVDLVRTIAVCAGAGTTVLKGVSADLYVTGEMLHHDVLDAVHKRTHVILTNHSDSERGYLKVFSSTLSDILNGQVRITMSTSDRDPLCTV